MQLSPSVAKWAGTF